MGKGQKEEPEESTRLHCSNATEVHQVMQHIFRQTSAITDTRHQCHTFQKNVAFYSHKESTIKIHWQHFIPGKLS